jgi:hypothetical protein
MWLCCKMPYLWVKIKNMIKYTKGSQEYKLRNLPNEITLLEMSKIAIILKDSSTLDKVDTYLKVIDILGDKGLSDVISFTNIQQFAENFQKDSPTDIHDSIEVNGRTYVYNPEPTAKAVSLVEKNIANNNGLVYLFAIAYEDEQLTVKEHNDPAHIKHKVQLFGANIMADISTPVLVKMTDLFIQHTQQLDESMAVAGAE